MAADCCTKTGEGLAGLGRTAEQRRAHQRGDVMAEFGGGIVARSAAVMADPTDMLRHAFVYALNRGARWQAGAATAKGWIIPVFGIAVIVEIADKVVNGVPPSSSLMPGFGGLVLAVNLGCLALPWRFRKASTNMSSTFECSRNHVASNIGVLVAAGLVGATGAAWPDVVVGGIIALIFLRSAWHVLYAAAPAWRDARALPPGVLR